jgi:V/A-type H+-transporting ATPase subunit I
VVCLEQTRQQTVDELGNLGIVHVTHVAPPESDELDRLTRQRDNVDRAQTLLEAQETEDDQARADQTKPADELVADILEADAEKRSCEERIQHAQKALDLLAPWGSFSRDALEDLRERGLHVTLCMASEDALPELPEGALYREVSRQGKAVYFAVVSREPPPDDLPKVAVPEQTDRSRLEDERDANRRRIEELNATIRALAGTAAQLEQRSRELTETIAFVQAREGMGHDGYLTYLAGYVPERRLPDLKQAAQTFGWALRIEDVDPAGGDAPVLLHMPRLFRIAKPIFDFVGILPGYNECDVSVAVLLFLTLFFGMIVGDAGYGLLFLAAGLAAKVRVRTRSGRLWANLFLVLSVTTIVWGALNGTWFAIPETYLPRFMRGVDWLTDSAAKNRHIQWLCFLIGAIHLSMARLWRAALTMRTRQALGYVGWAMLIWGNFFTAVELIVSKGSFPRFAFVLYGLGLLLILTCGVNWRDVGGVMNLPFDFIGSFVDVLSYIRLFAVGLSSYFIAASFNSMGRMVFDLSPWLLPAAVIVIAFGHMLNIALAFMGVLVHGIRLNTLEFSNHMELTWSGRPYQPLKRTQSQS